MIADRQILGHALNDRKIPDHRMENRHQGTVFLHRKTNRLLHGRQSPQLPGKEMDPPVIRGRQRLIGERRSGRQKTEIAGLHHTAGLRIQKPELPPDRQIEPEKVVPAERRMTAPDPDFLSESRPDDLQIQSAEKRMPREINLHSVPPSASESRNCKKCTTFYKNFIYFFRKA